jgi:hypothetical protein
VGGPFGIYVGFYFDRIFCSANKRKMMLKRAVLFIAFCLFFHSAYAQSLTSSELINNAKGYDGRIVVYKGEVIGDLMKRGDFAWANVNDGINAIGIWLPVSLSQEIIYTGSYKAKGDIIEVSGVFNRACSEHGGDLDIHAQTLRKIDSGRLIREKFNTAKGNQALILLGVLFLVWILTLFLRK